MKLVDPDGKSVAEPKTDYGLNKNGKIVQIGPENDKPDRLFVLDENGCRTKVDPLTINDKSILPQLAENKNPIKYFDPMYQKYEKAFVAHSRNKKDMYNLFKFNAKNSRPEWALQYFKDGSSTLSTSYSSGSVMPPNHSEVEANRNKTVTFDVHSHGEYGYLEFDQPSNSDWIDATRLKDLNSNVKSMIYLPNAKNPNRRMYDILNAEWVKNY